MALTLGDNFSYQGAKPLDGRLKYDTVAAMKAMADSTLYDGCLAYCVATDKTYQWKSTNTVDTDLGKWREFGGTVDSAISSTSENPVQNKVIKNALDGKADLVNGKVPANQLPDTVDPIIEAENIDHFPATGESNKIYIALDTNKTYRWGSSTYVEISESLALGETSSTAYRGDRGKEAYDISQTVGDVANLQTTAKNSVVAAINEVAGSVGVQLGETSTTAYRGDRGKEAYDVSQTVGSVSSLTTTDKSSVVAAINEVNAKPSVELGETSSTAYRGDRGKTAYDFSQTPYTSNPAMDGTASPGSSTAWAKGDHVHPKDTSKQDVLQYSTMPTAAAGNAGKIIQYIGTTTVTYKNGYFYKCVESSGSYSWQPATVQSAGTGGEIFVGTSAEWDKLTTGEKEAYKIVVIQQVYPFELTVGDQYTINGKTFKVAEDLGSGLYALQANSSWGKTAWPGYLAAGGITYNEFVNQSIAPYVSVANTWYNNAVKSMEADDYKYGPYLISSSKAQMSYYAMGRWSCGGPYITAMKDFVTTDSNRCWIGSHGSGDSGYVVSSTYVNNDVMQNASMAIAPAFNIDTRKVSIDDNNVMTPLDPVAGKIYVYNPTTGNLEARGHTILDNADTEYASRTNLKFGGDIAVADDSTNDATKVTPHRLTSAELQDIVSPLPSGQRTMPVLFDETGAEYVVGWYKRSSDGKKKPVYQKTIIGTLPTTTNEIQTFATHGIANIDNVHIVASSAQATDGTWYNIGTTSTLNVWDAWVNANSIRNRIMAAPLTSQTGNITLQYTKTSDSWE